VPTLPVPQRSAPRLPISSRSTTSDIATMLFGGVR
jgi:hypothetical protein